MLKQDLTLGFLVHQNRLVAPLEYVPHPVMATVEPLCENAVQLAHALAQSRLAGLYQQVVMIAHQAIRVATPLMPVANLGQYLKETLPIRIV